MFKIVFTLTFSLLSINLSLASSKHSKKKHGTPRSGVISFDVYQTKNIIDLLIVRSINNQSKLFHQRSIDNGVTYSPEQPITFSLDGNEMRSPKRGGDFQIASIDNYIMVAWEKKGSGRFGSGPIRTVLSKDGGKTWSAFKPLTNSEEGQGFMDFAATKGPRFHAIWLENVGPKRGLRHSSVDLSKGIKEASFEKVNQVDEVTCACCWNVLAKDSSGTLYSLYRDKKPSDMSLATSNDLGKSWKYHSKVGIFGWDFDGCPHVGGAIDFAADKSIHTTIWTGKEDTHGLYYQGYDQKKKQWQTTPTLISKKARRSDLKIVGDKLVIAYDIIEDHRAKIKVIYKQVNSEKFSEPKTIDIKSKFSEYPRIIVSKDNYINLFYSNRVDDSQKYHLTKKRFKIGEKVTTKVSH